MAYAAFWLGVGLFFSLAEVQHYVRGGGRHPWEPFLWEISGSLTAGVLALAVYRLSDGLLARRVGMVARIAAYLAGLVAFSLVHSALMYGMRTVAEGIEDVETLRALIEMGVELGQGFLLGRPSLNLP